jgi:GTP-binding protein EngB required for normal cell division
MAFTSNREDGVRRLWRTRTSEGAPLAIVEAPGYGYRWSPDGEGLYYATPGSTKDFSYISLENGVEHPVTRFSDQPGRLTGYMAVSADYLYFIWRNDLGDIWVMDVVTDEGE